MVQKFVLVALMIVSRFGISMTDSTPASVMFLDDHLLASCRAAKPILAALPKTKIIANLREKITAALEGRARFYNLSIAFMDDGYLVATRIDFLNQLDGDKIVPGNRQESKFEKGKNFWWLDWSSPNLSTGTLFFVADPSLSIFTLLVSTDQIGLSWLNGNDVRVMSCQGQLFAINAQSTTLAAAIIPMPAIMGSDVVRYCRFGHSIKNPRPDKNYGIFTIDENQCSYVDWFYDDGVKFISTNHDATSVVERRLKLGDGFKFSKKGSIESQNQGLLPLLSFGTPHLYDKGAYFGVGHLKIFVDKERHQYQDHSPLEKFRQLIDGRLKKRFGDKLIRHDSYFSHEQRVHGFHYLIYFYFVRFDGDGQPIEMSMSNGFLPVFLHNGEPVSDYVFSLVFPMTISKSHESGSDCLIAGGYGDYYAISMKLPLKWIKNQCEHSVATMDFLNYKYKLLVFEHDGKAFVSDTL